VAGDRRTPGDWGVHPPDYLRVLLVLEVLRRQGFADDAERLEKEWVTTYPRHAMRAFEPDRAVIAGALLAGPYPELGGGALSDVLAFTANDHTQAQDDADRLLAEVRPQTDDARVLFAAARLAYERDPAGYGKKDILGLVGLALSDKAGVRNQPPAEAARDALDAADRAAGVALYREMQAFWSR
jgi:hypothetical protein